MTPLRQAMSLHQRHRRRLVLPRFRLAQPERDAGSPHEFGFVLEVVAEDQETASTVLAVGRTSLLHTDFPGRLCKEGNMAFPFSPSDIPLGPHYRFNVFHTMALDDPCAPFRIEYETV